MKRIGTFMRTAAVLLILMMGMSLLGNAFALTTNEKEQKYATALNELESYLESPVGERDGAIRLNAIIDDMELLGNYQMSQEIKGFAFILLKIEENDFTDWQINVYLYQLCKSNKLSEYVADNKTTPITDGDTLTAYYEGRQAEAAGDYETAIGKYDLCLTFFDTMTRQRELTETLYADAYAQAGVLMGQEKYEEAYTLYSSCESYRDAKLLMAFIVDRLGYEPGVCGDAHTWEEMITKAATCIATGEKVKTCTVCGKTETVTIPKDSSNHTGGTEIRNQKAETCTEDGYTGDTYCKGCNQKIYYGCGIVATGHQWKEATYEAPKTCMVCGKTEGQPLPRIAVGDYITYGHYEQDNNTGNGKEAIEWLVLDYDAANNRALVISKYALDCKPYNTTETDITWEKCTLRAWLNGEFINAAFSSDEQKAIPTVIVNPDYNTIPGNATLDKVFLLSITEVKKYFKNSDARKCVPTKYAVANNAYKASNGSCWWWLRSPGYMSNLAACVYDRGDVSTRGFLVNRSGSAVRPALYIDLNLIP